mmetsp:Transcript_21006/g.43819  ORF Transcript_21006/g.43819 Transcript_21006/m.43819 type:complete len:255 (-) Transcript_21006:19-783(-)
MVSPITHLLFDIDDTLYPVTNGFTQHRNYGVACQFMVDHCGFENLEAATVFRNKYFEKYHSTIKALTVAAEEGALPPNDDGSKRGFNAADLANYWVSGCKFDEYIKVNEKLIEALKELKESSTVKLCIFTNGPRAYGLRVLEALKVREFFDDADIYGVDDVMPVCKPEPAAFRKVLEGIGCDDPSKCVMFEDSMKNVRASKEVGMKTVLIMADSSLHDVGDVPVADDPNVDVVMSGIGEMKEKLSCLWRGEWAL